MIAPGPACKALIRNAMSVDVEDYFQVQAFAGVIPRASWDGIDRRVEANVERILDQFARAGVHATFFTLGWIAERHPVMVRRIVAAGHELASHGYDHIRADLLDSKAFRADVGRTRLILEDIGGTAVRGYRAPTFSIGPRNPWAFEALESEGYRYSSSVYPIRHDLYGDPDAPRFPHQPGPGGLWEIPMSTIRLAGRNLPCAGGGYFRLLPYSLYQLALTRLNRSGRPGIFYFHPWEVDPGQPRVTGCSRLSRFRHYVYLSEMPARVDRLLREFAWDRVDQVFADLLAPATPR
jgi:polysaccharide deacetylase family protein (PEP-CTERM system associated)